MNRNGQENREALLHLLDEAGPLPDDLVGDTRFLWKTGGPNYSSNCHVWKEFEGINLFDLVCSFGISRHTCHTCTTWTHELPRHIKTQRSTCRSVRWLTGDLRYLRPGLWPAMAEMTESTPLDPAPQDRSRMVSSYCRSWNSARCTGCRRLHHCKQLESAWKQETGQFEAFWSGQELAGIHDVAVRNGFVRKVFSILTVQLLITTAIAASQLGVARVAPDISWYLHAMAMIRTLLWSYVKNLGF